MVIMTLSIQMTLSIDDFQQEGKVSPDVTAKTATGLYHYYYTILAPITMMPGASATLHLLNDLTFVGVLIPGFDEMVSD